MRFRILVGLIVLGLLGFQFEAVADTPKFIYKVGFAQNFDNREYAPSDYALSGTIFGTRLFPSIGFQQVTDVSTHKLIGGAEIRKDFGDINDIGKHLLKDYFYYYSYDRDYFNGIFSIEAGVFPRSLSIGEWNTAFFSEQYRWADAYIEGLRFAYESSRLEAEACFDWMGMYGSAADVKEKFMISTVSKVNLTNFLTLGHDAYMVHFANSVIAPGVSDNILIEPFIKADISSFFFINHFDLDLKLGYLYSLQRNRLSGLDFRASHLSEFTLSYKRKNVGITNSLFIGDDIMPLYDELDSAGQPYGDRFYFGDTFFMIRKGNKNYGFYDRLELFYTRSLDDGLGLKISTVFHFHNTGYTGCQQIIGLTYSFGNY